MLLVTRTQHI